MARPIRSIDLYLPLDYNDGEPIPESKYVALQQDLLRRFGGVTSVQREFPLQGVWQPIPHHQSWRADLQWTRCPRRFEKP
jgi:hypothetical protein